MQRKIMAVLGAAALIAGTAAFSMREVTFDSTTGTGFVGKGDVQLLFGLNNKALQAAEGNIDFRYEGISVTETTWTCSRINNGGNEVVTPRNASVTTSVAGVLNTVERMKNQITGFGLTGYDGTPESSTTSEGQALGSCPADGSGQFTYDENSETTTTTTSGGLQVRVGGSAWMPIS
jgi:hypothetical protein